MKISTVKSNGKEIKTTDNPLNTWVRDLKTGKLVRSLQEVTSPTEHQKKEAPSKFDGVFRCLRPVQPRKAKRER